MTANRLKSIPTGLPRSVRIIKIPKNQIRFIRDLDLVGLNNLGNLKSMLVRNGAETECAQFLKIKIQKFWTCHGITYKKLIAR